MLLPPRASRLGDVEKDASGNGREVSPLSENLTDGRVQHIV